MTSTRLIRLIMNWEMTRKKRRDTLMRTCLYPSSGFDLLVKWSVFSPVRVDAVEDESACENVTWWVVVICLQTWWMYYLIIGMKWLFCYVYSSTRSLQPWSFFISILQAKFLEIYTRLVQSLGYYNILQCTNNNITTKLDNTSSTSYIYHCQTDRTNN